MAEIGKKIEDAIIEFPKSTPVKVAGTANRFDSLYRDIILFDTSSLGDSANISAATLSLYSWGKANTLNLSDNHAGISLVSSNPNSNVALQNSDYATLGSTKYANDIAYSGITINQYNDMALNVAGKAVINKI